MTAAGDNTTSRNEREAEFQDSRVADDSARSATGKFYATVANAHADWLTAVQDAFAAAPGARVLEVGCSSGGLARQLGVAGVRYTGIDVSPAAIREANHAASGDGANGQFLLMDAQQTAFADGSFDLVFGRGVLHHLDTAQMASELARILRVGGTAIFQEPLGHNPLINTYRDRTPEMRSPDEHPLLVTDFDQFAAAIGHLDTTYYGASSLAMAPLQGRPGASRLTDLLMKLDQTIFQIVPRAGRYAWIANLFMTRR